MLRSWLGLCYSVLSVKAAMTEVEAQCHFAAEDLYLVGGVTG